MESRKPLKAKIFQKLSTELSATEFLHNLIRIYLVSRGNNSKRGRYNGYRSYISYFTKSSFYYDIVLGEVASFRKTSLAGALIRSYWVVKSFPNELGTKFQAL
jgi:hypothetical protein